jgi:hypothetical protein
MPTRSGVTTACTDRQGARWCRRAAVVLLAASLVLVSCSNTRGGEQAAPTPSSPARTYVPQAVPGAGSVMQRFDSDPTGQGALGWAPVLGEWTVQADPTAPSPPNVYAQVGTNDVVPPDRGAAGQLFGGDYAEFLDNIGAYQIFPSSILDDGTYGDVDLSVAYKPISGRVDQTGGLIFRAQGPGDYYIWRCNVLETDCRLWTYVGGQRTSVYQVEVAGQNVGEWQTSRVVAKGTRIEGYWNDRLVMEFDDDTFTKPGRVGLWTKADAVTAFDDFTATPL